MLVRQPGPGPWRQLTLPTDAGPNRRAGFGLCHLEPGQVADWPVETDGLEAVIVPLRGALTLDLGREVLALRGRRDVWTECPDLAYLPPGTAPRVAAGEAPAEFAVGWARTAGDGPAEARYVPASAVALEERGEGGALRHIRHLYEGDRPAARILVVEVLTPAGHWSSFPPHRHDEPPLEEFYYFETTGARRALLHIFDDPEADGRPTSTQDADQAWAVGSGQLALVAHGYHTVATPPGTELYYLNVMAGESRSWAPVFHPAYRDLVLGWERAPRSR